MANNGLSLSMGVTGFSRSTRHSVHSRCIAACLLVAIVLLIGEAAAERSTSRSRGGAAARFTGELGQQLHQLKEAWTKVGEVSLLPPAMLERGTSHEIALPETALNEKSDICATLVLLGAPNISFLVNFGDGGLPVSQRAWPVPSGAGVAEITRCGSRKRLLEELQVRMQSRRGMIEFLLLLSSDPPGAANEILQGRDPGPTMPSPHVGQRPYLSPIGERLASKRKVFVRRGATEISENAVLSDEAGRGARVFNLSSGCHRFAILAPSDKKAPPDVDARMFDVARAALLASDEEQAGEASLLHCTGQSARVRVDFNGTNPGSEVVILHARFELPEGIPLKWGSDARAVFARALHDTSLPNPGGSPIVSSLGVRGETQWRLEPRPGACYVVLGAPIRGESQRIQLRGHQGLFERHVQSREPNTGTGLGLCAQSSDPIHLSLHSVGTAVAWVMGVWELHEANAEVVNDE